MVTIRMSKGMVDAWQQSEVAAWEDGNGEVYDILNRASDKVIANNDDEIRALARSADFQASMFDEVSQQDSEYRLAHLSRARSLAHISVKLFAMLGEKRPVVSVW